MVQTQSIDQLAEYNFDNIKGTNLTFRDHHNTYVSSLIWTKYFYRSDNRQFDIIANEIHCALGVNGESKLKKGYNKKVHYVCLNITNA